MSLPVLVTVQVGREQTQMLLKAPSLEGGIDNKALQNRTSSKIT